jgi:uncharacterized protein GlcG (DUF336 family)
VVRAQLVKFDTKLVALSTHLPGPLRSRIGGIGQRRQRWVSIVLALVSIIALVPVAGVIGPGMTVGLGLGVLVLLVLCKYSEYCTSLSVVGGAAVVPWLALVTFNFLLGWAIRPLDLGLWTSLIIAGVVFAVAACAYLLVWKEHRAPAVLVALALAGLNVVGIPLLLAGQEQKAAVGAPQPVVSELDLAIIVPGGTPTALARVDGARAQQNWSVRWSVGRAGGDRLDWLLLDSIDPDAALAAARGSGTALSKAPAWREGADHVVLLDVDGTPPVFANPRELPPVEGRAGEINRWLAIAERAAPGAQVAALLQTTDRVRLAAWTKRVEAKGGTVASIQQLGSTSLTDAAQALAVQTPGAAADLSLATRFRPVLLFDRQEKLNSPLDVAAFFASGRVRLCHDDKIAPGDEPCPVISNAASLVSGPTHLKIGPVRRGAAPAPTAIYVHPTRPRNGGGKLLYLDYWWYLDGNPADIGSGATCGIGLAMPGKTCFNHPSDWEGMTVIVDVSDEEAQPVAVQYAQHKETVRYSWADERRRWADLLARPSGRLSAKVQQNLRAIQDLADRPVAFIGQGTHATYARPCTGNCHQTLASDLTENHYGGEVSWIGNDTAKCVSFTCVQLLPTRLNGKVPALWNAYTGVWGDRQCILRGSYCTSELSPGAPSTQPRYRDPARITGVVDSVQKPRRCGGKAEACPPL